MKQIQKSQRSRFIWKLLIKFPALLQPALFRSVFSLHDSTEKYCLELLQIHFSKQLHLKFVFIDHCFLCIIWLSLYTTTIIILKKTHFFYLNEKSSFDFIQANNIQTHGGSHQPGFISIYVREYERPNIFQIKIRFTHNGIRILKWIVKDWHK